MRSMVEGFWCARNPSTAFGGPPPRQKPGRMLVKRIRTAKAFAQLLRRILVHEVHLKDRHAVERVGRKQVDADDICLR